MPGTHLCGLLPNFIYNAVPLISSLPASYPHNSKKKKKKTKVMQRKDTVNMYVKCVGEVGGDGGGLSRDSQSDLYLGELIRAGWTLPCRLKTLISKR